MRAYLAQSQNPLLGSDAASLDHNKVLFDHSVVGESSHGVDALVGGVVLSGGVVLDKLKGKNSLVRTCSRHSGFRIRKSVSVPCMY